VENFRGLLYFAAPCMYCTIGLSPRQIEPLEFEHYRGPNNYQKILIIIVPVNDNVNVVTENIYFSQNGLNVLCDLVHWDVQY